ncbi:cytochrome c oxidase subunit 3 [Cyanobacterium sp. IPPAS B-1200]|uniref:cytochrome c oxidase subunit 3 n=1 Tax=Cyanobacterium sp. IPPAS B-1200 TaxID=1562720 RepID=UPI0008525935|nr:heme-copper oxidase subunit III [Cyanobacterium sp. IPPAS B-1200]OEJ77787.1 cytochrome B6 [Cyanobacterium sp. IPPAS B-1200]
MQSTEIDSQVTVGYEKEAENGHHGHPDLRMFGLVMFLIAESMIFFGLFSAYMIYYATMPEWPTGGIELELLLPGINSVILISSSFVMHKGQSCIKNNDEKGLKLWFGITALMGAIFLAGQGYEYATTGFGLTDSLFASCFYVLTGFHGLHVAAGLSFILAVLWRSREAGHYSAESHFGVEAAELYWHFVDVVWIILFGLVYLLPLT